MASLSFLGGVGLEGGGVCMSPRQRLQAGRVSLCAFAAKLEMCVSKP